MPDLNEEILELKAEGKSLRQIAATLGVSHVTALKRLRSIQESRKVVTSGTGDGLPQSIKTEGNPSNRSNPHTPRPSEELTKGGNEVVTKETPPLMPGPLVTTHKRPCGGSHGHMKEGYQQPYSGSSDLLSTIQELLEGKGIHMYRMKAEPEAYQVKHNGQIIRFYVQRKIGMEMAKEETEKQG